MTGLCEQRQSFRKRKCRARVHVFDKTAGLRPWQENRANFRLIKPRHENRINLSKTAVWSLFSFKRPSDKVTKCSRAIAAIAHFTPPCNRATALAFSYTGRHQMRVVSTDHTSHDLHDVHTSPCARRSQDRAYLGRRGHLVWVSSRAMLPWSPLWRWSGLAAFLRRIQLHGWCCGTTASRRMVNFLGDLRGIAHRLLKKGDRIRNQMKTSWHDKQ